MANNDIARWRYADLPKTLGIDDWLTMRITTCAELDAALDAARAASISVYIEVITDRYSAPLLATQLHDAIKTLYKA